MQAAKGLRRRAVYRHLGYRWQAFGIGASHLGLGVLPGCLYAVAVALASPDCLHISTPKLVLLAAALLAIADAFRPAVAPQVARQQALLVVALPVGLLCLPATLPLSLRALLPLWPCVPLALGGLVGLTVWQFRQSEQALSHALWWHFAPRRFSSQRRPARAPEPWPVDRGAL